MKAYTHYPKREQQVTNIEVSVDVLQDGDPPPGTPEDPAEDPTGRPANNPRDTTIG